MSLLYSEFRKELKTGDLLAWDTTEIVTFFDFVLFLYQKILKAKYSHVGIVLRFGERVFVMEAVPPFVRVFPLSMLSNFSVIKTNLNSSNNPEVDRLYCNALLKHSGKRYSLTDLIKGMFDMKPDDSSLYCSELALDFYRDIEYTTNEEAGITPDTIVEEIIKISGNQPVFVTIDRGNFDVI